MQCTHFRPHAKGFLLGFANLKIPAWHAEIRGCPVFRKHDSTWVNMPGNEFTASDGENKFAPFLRFDDDEMRKRFSAAAAKAVEAWIQGNATSSPPEPPEAPEFNDDDVPF